MLIHIKAPSTIQLKIEYKTYRIEFHRDGFKNESKKHRGTDCSDKYID